jgi:hypothetical protein
MISKLVKKVAASKRSQEASEVCGEGVSSESLPLQISDVFQAVDVQAGGRLTKKK